MKIYAFFLIIFSICTCYSRQVHIVIDPGHGTAHSRVGTAHEAELVMAVAVEVQKLLKRQHVAVTLTHARVNRTENLGATPSDDTVARAALANKKQATLFVRLHGDEPAGNAMICYPALHTDIGIAQESRRAAECIWKHIVPLVSPIAAYKKELCTDNDTFIGKQNGGLLEGSQYAQVPVVLIEMLPLNTTGITWLSDKKNQKKYARAIVTGIAEYLEQ
jgi:N-acetylmuramoyl-L-alanine amidase